MKVGDRVRLAPRPACRSLELPEGEVGVITSIDGSSDTPALLIRFANVDVYTSALHEDDIEVVSSMAPTRPPKRPG